MATQLSNTKQSLGHSLPHFLARRKQQEAAEDNKLTPKVLELANVLQRTLDIDELLRTFDRETRRQTKHQGMRYCFGGFGINLIVGHEAENTCSYDLQVNGESLGEIHFYRSTPFTSSQMTRLENLLMALVYPIRNALKYQLALKSALLDPLTGVENRAAMDIALKREIELSRRQDAPLSVILFDVDFFKRINDEFGHAAGDEALKSVVRCASKTVRSSDLVYRYGGEEFLVLLSYTDKDGAELLAERIRNNIEENCTVENHGAPLTVSLGVASLKGHEDADGLFKRADDALYKAKRSGRNQVRCAD